MKLKQHKDNTNEALPVTAAPPAVATIIPAIPNAQLYEEKFEFTLISADIFILSFLLLL